MPQGESVNIFWVIGYDLRVWSAGAGMPNSQQVSLDSSVWHSARELSSNLICDAYGIARISDISNGLNLAVSPPKHPAPAGFIWAAFDASEEIVGQISESFGMQHSLGMNSNALSTDGFVFSGYDAVDIWTQRTALYPGEIFQAILDSNRLELNEWGLFPTQTLATQGCLLANRKSPDSSSYQPVGVWIKRGRSE